MRTSPGPTPPGHRTPLLGLAELSLVVLTAVAALAFARLFVDWSWLPPVLAAVLVAHGIGILCRRLGWNAAVAALLSFAGLVVAISWLVLGDTTAFGLPTAETWHRVWSDLATGWQIFREDRAPAPALPGLVIAAITGAWVAAFVADTAAFRLGASIEAAVPSATLFVFAAALGTPGGRVLSTAAYLAALFGYALTQRALHQAAAPTWLAADTRAGPRALLGVGAVVGALAVAGAVVIGPALPGAEADAVIPWRSRDRDGGGGRVTVSPLVDIRSRLVAQSDVEVFTVRSNERAYWRLTALETFDGTIWSSSGSYRPADRTLSGPSTGDASVAIEQEFTIGALQSIWLPAAYEPREVAGVDDVTYDDESQSLVTRQESSDGLTYRVRSVAPRPDPEALEQAPRSLAGVSEDYVELPADFSTDVVARARAETADADTQYAKALALQDFFRDGSFTYDLDVVGGHDGDAIERFLRERRGYCEQFAGTYAAMARAVGLPARVAVGFTPGELGDDGRFHVRGLNAHAWPEVYLSGHGWVAFEPTPGRGMPDAETWTGVPEEQPSAAEPGTPTTLPTSPATTPSGEPADAVPSTIFQPGDLDADGGDATAAGDDAPLTDGLFATAIVGLVGTVVWVVALATAHRLRRHRRRTAAAEPAERVSLAWTEVSEALARVDVRRHPWETSSEFAQRAAASTGLDARLLGALARATSAVDYGPARPSAAAADHVVEVAGAMHEELSDAATWRQRLRWALDPRPLLPARQAHLVIERA